MAQSRPFGMDAWLHQGGLPEKIPTFHIVSDSTGITAQAIAKAAAACFGEHNPSIEILPQVKDSKQMIRDLSEHFIWHQEHLSEEVFLIFSSLSQEEYQDVLEAFCHKHSSIILVDVIGNAVQAIVDATGLKPKEKPGSLHSVNKYYLNRIEAMEFTINHDDGRNPQDLSKADIVIIGVSRSSKTPLSVYLSQMGYKVANIPIDPQTAPPKELFEVETSRVFGLMTNPELLSEIRKRRLGNAGVVASKYADLESVYADLENARELMRKLGCIVVRTDNRAIEETAQEILRYYESTHPKSNVVRMTSE